LRLWRSRGSVRQRSRRFLMPLKSIVSPTLVVASMIITS